MMVLFISRSEKKSIYTVRKILDNFADRVGNDTWKTVITEEGLQTVKILLQRHATKNMAVSCHWIRSRSHSELCWIIGNRNKFNEEGVIPIGTTHRNINHNEWESNWQYLPEIKMLAAIASLMHDLGKSSKFFQTKLKQSLKHKTSTPQKAIKDPFRHEWISCKILEALVQYSEAANDDHKWLQVLAEGTVEEKKLITVLQEQSYDKIDMKTLPPIARLVVWIVLSHHKIPQVETNRCIGFEDISAPDFDSVMNRIDASWGYQNEICTSENEKSQCFYFPNGLLIKHADVWQKQVKRWARKMLQNQKKLVQLVDNKLALRLVLSEARLCLMMGDYYYSSLPTQHKTTSNYSAKMLWANTDHGMLKQTLEEHIVGVTSQSVRIAQQLPRFANGMETVYDVPLLRKRSPKLYHWQDVVVEKIREFRRNTEEQQTFFVVNMASTGCGKTLANAKIMQAVSDDEKSLRYILALGLRTLTLQTGDEYRQKIGLDISELAVLIGSSAVRELHDIDQLEEPSVYGQETLQNETVYVNTENENQQFLSIFFQGSQSSKHKALLYKPILVTTIDHLMGATETVRGGRYMLPFLRLLSSDLVIDEIDDFTKKDLIAIARLVHLAGMMGRNVTISSATIPPDLAEGMYRAYIAGLSCHNAFFTETKRCNVVFCDEFKTVVQRLNTRDESAYGKAHASFIKKRIAKLEKQPIKRKGEIVPVDPKKDISVYLDAIRQTVERLHITHHIVDDQTGKKVSFGVIRIANIDPCVKIGQYLLTCNWSKGYTVKIMVYHSRQILLLRHAQEKYLDHVLKRKDEKACLQDAVVRQVIDTTSDNNIIFIVVATPVEEVGRDHDFDWAIIEPSSYRSIIQLSGRVLRHRICKKNINVPNIAVMQFNIKGVKAEKGLAFIHPGYESKLHHLQSHDIMKLINVENFKTRIDAIPRIQKNVELHPEQKLIDLEQQTMADFNNKQGVGPATCNGWQNEWWWMTAVPQKCNRFREQTIDTLMLYAVYCQGNVTFCEYDEREKIYQPRDQTLGIQSFDADDTMKKRLWLSRNYIHLLRQHISNTDIEDEEKELERISKRFGEVAIPDKNNHQWYYSDDFGFFKQ